MGIGFLSLSLYPYSSAGGCCIVGCLLLVVVLVGGCIGGWLYWWVVVLVTVLVTVLYCGNCFVVVIVLWEEYRGYGVSIGVIIHKFHHID